MRDNSMGPVFLLAGGGRTGSTLIQRLIISSGEIMLWGEHGGIILPQLRKLFNQLNAWCDKANSQTHLSDFRASSHAAWMPNINPGPPFMLAGCRAFLEQSLGVAARNMGYKRWASRKSAMARKRCVCCRHFSRAPASSFWSGIQSAA